MKNNIQDLYEELVQDTNGQDPLYLDRDGISMIFDCLNEVKDRMKESGDWSTKWENPNCHFCVVLDDTIAKVGALLHIVETDTDSKSTYVNLYIHDEPYDDVPF